MFGFGAFCEFTWCDALGVAATATPKGVFNNPFVGPFGGII
jgi:hypothetical protein